jgi:hypothetical protein
VPGGLALSTVVHYDGARFIEAASGALEERGEIPVGSGVDNILDCRIER